MGLSEHGEPPLPEDLKSLCILATLNHISIGNWVAGGEFPW